MGMTAAEMDSVFSPPVGVFTDNWRAAKLLWSIFRQWRVGKDGPSGLDYNVLYHKMDRMHLDPADYDQIEEDIGIMETAALKTMRMAKP